ncbi:MGH1-like glycoside hydrolase domain-containing protein [Streptomyces sp. NPDC101181]|uniref:glucosylglycerate hydrolase n=1 Tax=Streptomyces sp. NPDC101181 TaxID=3366125 RepID=UPI0037F848B3
MTTAAPLSTAPARITVPRTRPALGDTGLAARAAYVLRGNDLGSMTAAAPRLYPHMWSWDAAFISVGIAQLSVERALTELETLLGAQWRTGMLPHIVFSPRSTGYFPGPERWGCAELAAAAPAGTDTSGICQPPVHAIALMRIVEVARRTGGEGLRAAEKFTDRAWTPLMRWHRWLVEQRDPEGTGRITLHHGWESGTDNSPRWDGPYSRVHPGASLPAYRRRDREFVADPSHRPSDGEYDRYLWLVEEMRRADYDDAAVRRTSSFAVEDVLTSALLALACDALADLGEELPHRSEDVAQLRAWAARFRAGVVASVAPETGLARDRDLRAGRWLATETLAGFAPLLCGGLDPAAERRLRDVLDSERWLGNPGLFAAVPPSTAPGSDAFRSRAYWRGPQWPVMAWLFGWAFARRGWPERSEAIRREGLRLVGDGTFAEYYEPFTGEPLGSLDQSWTAAVTLDWLC